MRRPRVLLFTIITIGVAMTACSSTGASQQPGSSSGGAPSTGGAPSAEAPSQPAQSQGGGGGGGGGGGLSLPDGAWTGGHAQAAAHGSGTDDVTVDADLVPQTSVTTGGTTVLSYIDANASTAITIAIYPDSFAISVTSSSFVGGAGTTSNSPCEVTYNRSDDNAIDATFECKEAPVVFGTGAGGTVDLQGSFSASR